MLFRGLDLDIWTINTVPGTPFGTKTGKIGDEKRVQQRRLRDCGVIQNWSPSFNARCKEWYGAGAT